jgi:hypothetical protein
MRPCFVALLVTLALALAGCVHATGHLPSGPPPEYEETPLPTSASTVLPGDAALPSLPPALPPASKPPSEPPALH